MRIGSPYCLEVLPPAQTHTEGVVGTVALSLVIALTLTLTLWSDVPTAM